MRPENIVRYLSLVEKVLQGATYREAGESENVSPERARQIFNNVRRMMSLPRMMDEPFPDDFKSIDFYLLSNTRKHKEFWLRRVNKLRIELGDMK